MSNIPAAVQIVASALAQRANATEIVDRLIASGHIVGAQSAHTKSFDALFRGVGGTISGP